MMLNALPAELVAKVMDYAENKTIARLRKTTKSMDLIARSYKLDKIRPYMIKIDKVHYFEHIARYFVQSRRAPHSIISEEDYFVIEGSDLENPKYLGCFDDLLRAISETYGAVQYIELTNFQQFNKDTVTCLLTNLKPLRRNRTRLTLNNCEFADELTELSGFFNFFSEVDFAFRKSARHFTDQFLLGHTTNLHIRAGTLGLYYRHYDFRHITDTALTKFAQDYPNIPNVFKMSPCVTSFTLDAVLKTIETLLPLKKKLRYDFGIIKLENDGEDNTASFDWFRTFPNSRILDSAIFAGSNMFSCGCKGHSQFAFKTMKEFTEHFKSLD